MSDKEREIITQFRHPVFTVEYLEEWTNRNDSVCLSPVSALQIAEAKGFYEAVKLLAREESACKK